MSSTDPPARAEKTVSSTTNSFQSLALRKDKSKEANGAGGSAEFDDFDDFDDVDEVPEIADDEEINISIESTSAPESRVAMSSSVPTLSASTPKTPILSPSDAAGAVSGALAVDRAPAPVADQWPDGDPYSSDESIDNDFAGFDYAEDAEKIE